MIKYIKNVVLCILCFYSSLAFCNKITTLEEQPSFLSSGCAVTVNGDCTLPLNEACATPHILQLDDKYYHFKTEPNPLMCIIRGQGRGITVLFRDFSPSNQTHGLFTWIHSNTYSGISDVSVTTEGTVGGCVFSFLNEGSNTPTGSDAPANVVLDRLYITGNNSHRYGICVYGALPGAVGYGVRVINLRDVQLFAGTEGAAYFSAAPGISWFGGATAGAGGSSGKVVLTGPLSTVYPPAVADFNTMITVSALDELIIDWAYYTYVLSPNIGKLTVTNNAGKVCVMSNFNTPVISPPYGSPGYYREGC